LLSARNEITRPTVSGGEIFSAPGLGLVYAFLDSPRNFFAVGLNGLAVRRGTRFEMLLFEDRTSVTGLNGIVEARNGDLWLNGARGIVRVPANELQTALAQPAHRMKSELVTEGDFAGLSLTADRVITAARDADGNLWFVTRNGVLHLDPEHRRSDIRPPIVSIRSIAADRIPLGAAKTFSPRPQTLEIHYFGVHLTDPDRVTYRYRLVGFDGAWQDAGGRTEAFYTNLPSGDYTFQVIASSGNDAWTAPVSSPEFTVLPAFYQTTWFKLLVIGAAIAFLFGIFTLRVRAVTRSVRARAEERADERIRIARELHDTLLQGIQGLLLNFHVAAQRIAPDNASRAMLERTLATADRIILEGRNRVISLRSEQLTDGELAAALENAGRDLALGESVEFKVTRSGRSAKLLAHVADEIFVIAREALTNAYRHSGASHIRIELEYGRRYFSMICSDDGCGFDENSAEKQGHWGLRGMAERARKLGGRLRARSESARGTDIIASVPSYRAYRRSSQLIFWLGALSFSERDPAR
jgi:signal transduction histidine kinase